MSRTIPPSGARFRSSLLIALAPGLVLFPALASAAAGLPVPPQGFSGNNNNIPHGDVETTQFPTQSTGNQAVTVYTPPGYTTDEQYPVLYLHHGIGGNATAWISSEGNADNVMDHLYSEGLATPMIVIMPDGNTKNADGSTRGNNQGFEVHTEVLLNDLIPWVESTYSVVSDPDWRAIAGLSMGGGQTLNIGFPNSDVFHYLGAFSSAPNSRQPSQNITDPGLVDENMHFIFISCGDQDGLFGTSENYHNFLADNGVDHMWQIEPGQGHTPEVWNRSLYHFAQRIFQDLDEGGGGDNGAAGADGSAGASGAPATGGAGGSDDGMGGEMGLGGSGDPGMSGGSGGTPPAMAGAPAGGGMPAAGGGAPGGPSGGGQPTSPPAGDPPPVTPVTPVTPAPVTPAATPAPATPDAVPPATGSAAPTSSAPNALGVDNAAGNDGGGCAVGGAQRGSTPWSTLALLAALGAALARRRR